MVALLPVVLFFHCCVNKVDSGNTLHGSKSCQGQSWLLATGTGVCMAVYHWVFEANDEAGTASFPPVKLLPPLLEMMVCGKSTFYAFWVSLSVVTKAEVVDGLRGAVPLRQASWWHASPPPEASLLPLPVLMTSCQLLPRLGSQRPLHQLAVIMRMCSFPQQPAPSLMSVQAGIRPENSLCELDFCFPFQCNHMCFKAGIFYWSPAMFSCKGLCLCQSHIWAWHKLPSWVKLCIALQNPSREKKKEQQLKQHLYLWVVFHGISSI